MYEKQRKNIIIIGRVELMMVSQIIQVFSLSTVEGTYIFLCFKDSNNILRKSFLLDITLNAPILLNLDNLHQVSL